jgi:hypothetical protein
MFHHSRRPGEGRGRERLRILPEIPTFVGMTDLGLGLPRRQRRLIRTLCAAMPCLVERAAQAADD